jgi:trimeric autotransporter adhesin
MRHPMAWLAVLVPVCLLAALAAPAAAQSGPPVPRLVKFTGVVAGGPGAVDVVFALYADQTSETPLWTETQHVVVDASGRYAIHLGASQPEGLPVGLFATGDARWLGVRIEGQAELPRVLLVSVPYALKAADAETIGGKPLPTSTGRP